MTLKITKPALGNSRRFRVHLMDGRTFCTAEHIQHYIVEAENADDAITIFALQHWNEIQTFKHEHGPCYDIQAYPENR